MRSSNDSCFGGCTKLAGIWWAPEESTKELEDYARFLGVDTAAIKENARRSVERADLAREVLLNLLPTGKVLNHDTKRAIEETLSVLAEGSKEVRIENEYRRELQDAIHEREPRRETFPRQQMCASGVCVGSPFSMP